MVTPITLIFILILANRRSLLGAAANGRLARTVGVVTVAVVGASPASSVVVTVLGWIGVSL